MTPFAVEQVWHAGRPIPIAEKGSTLGLLVQATIRRITAAAASPIGCPCCRCSIRSGASRIVCTARSSRSKPQRRRGIPDAVIEDLLLPAVPPIPTSPRTGRL